MLSSYIIALDCTGVTDEVATEYRFSLQQFVTRTFVVFCCRDKSRPNEGLNPTILM